MSSNKSIFFILLNIFISQRKGEGGRQKGKEGRKKERKEAGREREEGREGKTMLP